jgi:hypothetical protein
MYAYAIIAVVVLLLAVGGWYASDAIIAAIRAPVQAQLELCKANGLSLEKAIAGQNRAVDALKSEQAARLAASEAELERARRDAAAADRRARGLLGAAPAKPDDLCESALILSREQIKGRR